MSHLHWHSPRHGDGALVEQTLCTADERAFRRSAASLLMRDEARRISSNCRSCYTRFSPPIRFAPGLMTVDVLFLAAAVPQAPVGDARAGHIPVGADIQEAARAGTHIREAARAGTHIREAARAGTHIREVARAGTHIREVAHIRGAVGSKAPHSANTCDRMDPDGNLADTERARTRSA